jgi:hypothetical protein
MRKVVSPHADHPGQPHRNADGTFWEPFGWGEEEMAWINARFRAADTWALGRQTYEAIVPWWDQVAAGQVPDDAPELTAADRELAALLQGMTKVVFSRTLEPTGDRVVLQGDIAAELAALKRRDGRTSSSPAAPPPSPPRRRARPDRRVPPRRPPRGHHHRPAAVRAAPRRPRPAPPGSQGARRRRRRPPLRGRRVLTRPPGPCVRARAGAGGGPRRNAGPPATHCRTAASQAGRRPVSGPARTWRS